MSDKESEGLQELTHITKLTEEDYEAVAELIRETIETSWAGVRPDKLNRLMAEKYTAESLAKRQETTMLWVARDESTKRILGIIGLKGNELRTFFVDPKAQGRGVGRQLFETLRAQAIANGAATLVLEASEVGVPVYERFGFQQIQTIEKQRSGVPYRTFS